MNVSYRSRWSFFVPLAVVLALSACSDEAKQPTGLPYYEDASFTPKWVEGGAATATLHRIPPFSLVDQTGMPFDEKTVAGKVYVANFFFTSCPGICPKMTANLHIIADEFSAESRVAILSHSVTPDKDTVEVLEKYATKNGIDASQWHLLTGSRDAIYHLGRKAYFVEEDLGLKKKADEFLHTENFVLIDADRHIRGIYNGLNKTSVGQLIKDTKVLLSSKNVKTPSS